MDFTTLFIQVAVSEIEAALAPMQKYEDLIFDYGISDDEIWEDDD
ncbi:MAG: hypothetical protein ACO3YZ_03590 [Candidatus Nanopelagicaceae bacterium]